MMLTASAVSVYRFQRIGNQLNHIGRLYVNNLFVSKTYSKTDYRNRGYVFDWTVESGIVDFESLVPNSWFLTINPFHQSKQRAVNDL